jgi:hypothetical protein
MIYHISTLTLVVFKRNREVEPIYETNMKMKVLYMKADSAFDDKSSRVEAVLLSPYRYLFS